MHSRHSGAPAVEEDATKVDALLERIAQSVQIACESQIREYLLHFVDLAEVVPHAVETAQRHFPEAQLVLDVYQDPEIDDKYLVLYVRMRHYDDSVVERIRTAEAEYLGTLADKSGWIQLTTDFLTPNE